MESENKNYALRLFKALKSMAGPDGKVHVDMLETCRAARLDEVEVRDCLADLEGEGYIETEIVCRIAEGWR